MLKINHPVKNLRLGATSFAKVHHVELKPAPSRKEKTTVQIIIYYVVPDGLLAGQVVKQYIDAMPEDKAFEFYPDACWYGEGGIQ